MANGKKTSPATSTAFAPPWRADGHPFRQSVRNVVRDRWVVWFEDFVRYGDGGFVASVKGKTREEAAANGCLMAAAPELLQRCQMALADAEAAIADPSKVAVWNWKSIANDLREVIAKAKGE